MAELNRLLRTQDSLSPTHRRLWVTHTAVRIALDVAIILGLGIAVMACIPLVIWLWMVVL